MNSSAASRREVGMVSDGRLEPDGRLLGGAAAELDHVIQMPAIRRRTACHRPDLARSRLRSSRWTSSSRSASSVHAGSPMCWTDPCTPRFAAFSLTLLEVGSSRQGIGLSSTSDAATVFRA